MKHKLLWCVAQFSHHCVCFGYFLNPSYILTLQFTKLIHLVKDEEQITLMPNFLLTVMLCLRRAKLLWEKRTQMFTLVALYWGYIATSLLWTYCATKLHCNCIGFTVVCIVLQSKEVCCTWAGLGSPPPLRPITSPMFPCSNAKFTGKLLPNPNFLLTGLLCQVKLLLKHLFFQTVNDEGLRALSFFWSDCLSLFMMCRYFTLFVVSDIKIMTCQAALPFLTKKARDEDTHSCSAVFYIITHTFILFISCFQVFHKERYHREAQYEDTHIILSPSLFSAKIIRFALSSKLALCCKSLILMSWQLKRKNFLAWIDIENPATRYCILCHLVVRCSWKCFHHQLSNYLSLRLSHQLQSCHFESEREFTGAALQIF